MNETVESIVRDDFQVCCDLHLPHAHHMSIFGIPRTLQTDNE